jgi:GNAT superfamily N-acetyltransferase
MPIRATRTYLEMTAPPTREDLCTSLTLERLRPGRPDLYRLLYADVGRAHHWVDRLEWTDRRIDEHLARPDIHVWVVWQDETPAGYFELVIAKPESTEIGYFGLRPAFIGRGLGKAMLSSAIDKAWDTGVRRVWLHTSTLDHPAALSNYVKRGFVPFKTEEYEL